MPDTEVLGLISQSAVPSPSQLHLTKALWSVFSVTSSVRLLTGLAWGGEGTDGSVSESTAEYSARKPSRLPVSSLGEGGLSGSSIMY